MFPQSCSMVEEGSNMKIPMFHKTAIKSKCRADKSDGYSKKTVPSKSVDHKIGSVCEIENAIEIQWNCSYFQTFLILLVSWLPMLLVLYLVHSSASHQIDNQRLEVAVLETQMSSMRRELLFLKKKLSSLGTQSFEEMPENVIVKEDSEEKSVVVLEDTNIMRIKRNVKNEMQNDFTAANSPSREVAMNNTARRGKQVSSRKPKRKRAQHRHQCPKPLGFSSTKCGGVQAIHLKGAHPETVVEAGHIGPWFIDSTAVRDSGMSSSFQLREDGESIEIESAGLYFIYAQVYYLTSHTLNSFIIKLTSKDSDNSSTLAYCSSNTVSASATSEISCFTATIHTLKAGDRIYVQQREKQRRLIMRTGHSFLGLVRLGAS